MASKTELSSRGPIPTEAPVFGLGGGEIMHTEPLPDGFVQLHEEDPDEPGHLLPSIMYPEDLEDLRHNQP